MLKKIFNIAWVTALSQFAYMNPSFAATNIRMQGVNLSGAEFRGCAKTARYGFEYIYPKNEIFDIFLGHGMNGFRLPFCWERLQPTALQELDAAEIGRIDAAVNYATARGAYIILDPHNYGAYWGKPFGSGTTNEMFADLWRRLAVRYAQNDHVVFGLMNEPHGFSSETWLSAANAAIASIRSAGAKNLILVPGTAWTGAHSWASVHYGTANGVSMLNIVDPANHYAYEVHQYFDKDSSGTKPECIDENIGVKRIAEFTAWAKANNKQAVMGEFGVARSSVCYRAMYNMLAEMQKNPDVWIGWTYWNTGAWVQNYMFGLPLYPKPEETSQLDVLKMFLPGGCALKNDCPAPNAPVLQMRQ